jgi:tetratricopeptide (TPR) repeat protein
MNPIDRLLAAGRAAMDADDRAAMLRTADEILAREPAHPAGLAIAGAALLREQRFGLAAQLLGAASRQRPDDAELMNNFACALQEWHPQEALGLLQRAMAIDPELDAPIQNAVSTLSTLGRFRQAVEIGRDYLEKHNPGDPDVNHNLALAELQVGEWRQAWPRWKLSGKTRERLYAHEIAVQRGARRHEARRWDGGGKWPDDFLMDPDGWVRPARPIVAIYGEQGLGDEILAGALVEKAIASGAEVILECEPRLEGLFRRSFPGAQVFGTLLEEAPRWVDQVQPTHKLASMGLFELYAPEPFRRKPYLVADPQYRAMFRGLLDSLGDGLKVGVAWTGGVKPWDRAQRCISPDVLGPILSSPGCQFVSLEYQFEGPPPADVHEFPWATAKGVDYDLTAALIAELDLVISVPQTCVDAAGALGTECWVLTPPVPQWRFSETAGDEAWVYEGVSIIRRQGPFWHGAAVKAAQRLRRLVESRAARSAAE